LKKFVPLSGPFSNNEIKFGSLQERINNQKYFYGMIPEEMKDVTLIADTNSFWIIKRDTDSYDGPNGVITQQKNSQHFENINSNLQGNISDGSWTHFRYVSEAKPAASHDIERMREVLPEIEANLYENDKIVLDKGYVGLEKEVTKGIWLIKKKAHRDYPLKEEDIKFNQKIKKVRREYISPILKLSKKKKKQNKTPENSSDDSEANYSQPNVDQTKEKFKLTNIIDQNRSQLTNEEEEKQKHKKNHTL
jgi:hypothetical protein